MRSGGDLADSTVPDRAQIFSVRAVARRHDISVDLPKMK
jgi:hypothetical protein